MIKAFWGERKIMRKYLYKYRSIQNTRNLEKDRSLNNLFECKAIFSSRKKFNDLFDSKIHFTSLTEKDVQRAFELGIAQSGLDAKSIESMLSTELNKILDAYVFYSVSANAASNLMWSHYADSHRGFCIEFKKENLNASPINYSTTIAELGLMYCLDVPKHGERIGKSIQKALLVKLNEWKYEREYRVFPDNQLRNRHLTSDRTMAVIPYEPDWVESIIFGCRMPSDAQKYIIDNYPHKTYFKKTIERKSHLEIVSL